MTGVQTCALPILFINKVQVYDRAMGETTDILDIYDIERIEAALQKLKITDTTVFLPQDQQEIGGMYEISFYDQSAKTPACIIELAPFSFQAGTQKTAYLQAGNADAVIQELSLIHIFGQPPFYTPSFGLAAIFTAKTAIPKG